jgi:hypothetical protein
VAFSRALGLLLLIAAPAGAAEFEPSEPEQASAAAPALSAIRFSHPAAGATLREGDIVEIRWSGVPADADEVELLLSVDGGRHFSLRLTEELDATSGSWLWRVPALETDNAALAIRMGVNGKEITSAPGPRFRLSPGLGAAGASLRWQGGEIWMDSGDRAETAGPVSPSSPCLSAEPTRIASVPGDSDPIDLPRTSKGRAVRIATETGGRALRDAEGAFREVLLTISASRVPLSIPQRI